MDRLQDADVASRSPVQCTARMPDATTTFPNSTGRPPAGQTGSPGPPHASQISWLQRACHGHRPAHAFRIQAAVINGRQRRLPFSSVIRHSMPSKRGYFAVSRAVRTTARHEPDARPRASRRLRQRDDTHGHDLGGVGSRSCPALRRNATRLDGSKPLRHHNVGVRVAGLDRGPDHLSRRPQQLPARQRLQRLEPHDPPGSHSIPDLRRPGPVGGTGGGLGGWYHRSIM